MGGSFAFSRSLKLKRLRILGYYSEQGYLRLSRCLMVDRKMTLRLLHGRMLRVDGHNTRTRPSALICITPTDAASTWIFTGCLYGPNHSLNIALLSCWIDNALNEQDMLLLSPYVIFMKTQVRVNERSTRTLIAFFQENTFVKIYIFARCIEI